MAAECGEVVVGGARALFAMSSRSISARMASRGAARRAHSTQMRWIAVLMGSGGSTSAITCSSSERHCFLVVSSWHHLSSTKAGSGNAKSAHTVVCSLANTNFANAAVHSANSWQRCLHASLANTFSRTAVLWQHCLLRMAASSSATSAAVRGGEN
jgi:hypothetical protein